MITRYFWLGLAGLLGAVGLTAATLYHHATLLSLAAGADDVINPGYLLVADDGVIAALGRGDGADNAAVRAAMNAPGFTAMNLSGRIVMPGFVSGHSHLWQSAFRGLTPAGSLIAWLHGLHGTYTAHFQSGDFGAFTRHGAYDQLRHGVTTTYNHSQDFGGGFELYREQFAAELTTPQRFVFAWENDGRADDAVWQARLAAVVAAVQTRADRPLLGVAVNSVGIHRAAWSLVAREVAVAKKFGLGVQIHYLEAAGEQERDRALWPQLKEAGAVYKGTTFAHFIHVDDAILRDAVAAGAGMIWNPLSNGRLGSGLPPIEHYLAAGLHVGMGVDGQASADISDPFENVRLGLYALRMRRENTGGLQPVDMLRLHTLKTAEVLGVQRWVGSLEVGKFADFLVVDPGEPSTGPVWDVAATLVFACSSRNLTAVYIGGRKIVDAGVVLGHDTAALEIFVRERVAGIRARQAADTNPKTGH